MPFRPLERGFMTTGEYERGYQDGFDDAVREGELSSRGISQRTLMQRRRRRPQKPKKKRTLSAWQKFMKSPKSQIKIKRGKDKGKLNLKAMAKEYRKKKRGKK